MALRMMDCCAFMCSGDEEDKPSSLSCDEIGSENDETSPFPSVSNDHSEPITALVNALPMTAFACDMMIFFLFLSGEVVDEPREGDVRDGEAEKELGGLL